MDSGETATLTQLTESPGGMRWSPDGRHIAFNMLVPYAPPSLATPPRPPAGAEWAVARRSWRTASRAPRTESGTSTSATVTSSWFRWRAGRRVQVTDGDFQHSSAAVWTARRPPSRLLGEPQPGLGARTTGTPSSTSRRFPARARRLRARYAPSPTAPGPTTVPPSLPTATSSPLSATRTASAPTRSAGCRSWNWTAAAGGCSPAGLDRSVSSPVWAADGSGVYFQYDERGQHQGRLRHARRRNADRGRGRRRHLLRAALRRRLVYGGAGRRVRVQPDPARHAGRGRGGRAAAPAARTITSLNADLLWLRRRWARSRRSGGSRPSTAAPSRGGSSSRRTSIRAAATRSSWRSTAGRSRTTATASPPRSS